VARFVALTAAALLLCGTAAASEPCAVTVSTVSSAAGTGLQIDGSGCKASLDTFWHRVERRLVHPLPPDIRWFSVIGPVGPDHRAALSAAWAVACKHSKNRSATFLRAYGAMPASQVLVPALATLRPVPDSIDNFYPVMPSPARSAIGNPACPLELLPPVIYYRLQAPNNSSKPTPLRGAA
jgi:hypothetical protein